MDEPLGDHIMSSALQRMVCYERQCTLIHILGTGLLNAAKFGGLIA